MNWLNGAVVFVIAWWVILFMTLPFGAHPPAQPGKGHAASAPANPRLGLKVLVTTVLAAAVTALVLYVIDQGWISFRPGTAPF
ncbi:MAG: DUF1467 family protein [Geminicoccaceae bacterium]|nr:MAG: DUF1467 family protein [Geminicoccaceae bacterium]